MMSRMVESTGGQTERPAGCPWGVSTSPAQTTSLAEVMSEQLASDLVSRDEEQLLLNLSADDGNGARDERDASRFMVAKGTVDDNDCSDDLMIAQMLQMQFDNENDVVVDNEERAKNGCSKLTISYQKYKVLQSDLPIWQDSDDEDPDLLAYLDSDERQRDWDCYDAAGKDVGQLPRCGYKKVGDSIITKHNKELSERANGKRIMSFPPGIKTGDGGDIDMQLSNSVFNSIRNFSIREGKKKSFKVHDKTEKSTSDQAVDPQTKLILFKLINSGILESVNGVISTGKEAVILHAKGGPGPEEHDGKDIFEPMVIPEECVLKVFKTSLNEFKSRDKYIKDDYRFRARFSKQNPRKIIHMWAEKELHNLMKMSRHGIRVPKVVLLKKHVLLMSFVGKDGKSAPKLKNADLSSADLEVAYDEVITMMKKLYHSCCLVHADLSEYNILWHEDHCWFIDVSQSVELNHPQGLKFLYRDCVNVSNFFSKKGVHDCLSPRDIFTLVSGLVLEADVKSEADILSRIRDYTKSEDLLTLGPSLPEESVLYGGDPNEPDLEELMDGSNYPFDFCWEQSLRTRNGGRGEGGAALARSIPGHSKSSKGNHGKPLKSPKSPSSGWCCQPPRTSSYQSTSLVSMTDEELKDLKSSLTENEAASSSTKGQKQVKIVDDD